MNRFSKIIISLTASTLLFGLEEPKKFEHICSNPTRGELITGIVISKNLKREETMKGAYMGMSMSNYNCSSIEEDASIFAAYSPHEDLDFKFLDGAGLNEKNKLIIKTLGITTQIGKNICFKSDKGYLNTCMSGEIKERKRSGCLCNHFNVGLATIFLYDKLEIIETIQTTKNVKINVTNKDLGLGISGSFEWFSKMGSFIVMPEVGIYTQVWNKSKLFFHSSDGADLSNKIDIVDRKKFKYMLKAGFSTMFSFTKNIDLVVKPFIIKSVRVVKDLNDGLGELGNTILIEDRLVGFIGIGLSYCRI